jgi:GTP cyclohydrolase IA
MNMLNLHISRSLEQIMEDEENVSVVTSSPIVIASSDRETPHQNDAVKPTICPKRAQGQVCICTLCEAARMRLLDRASKSDPSEVSSIRWGSSHAAASAVPGGSAVDVRPFKRLRQHSEDYESSVAVGAATGTLDSGDSSADEDTREKKIRSMTIACRTILECIGEDPSREGLQKTPERWAKALLYMCQGYQQSPVNVTNGAVFQENHNEMVVVRNIDIHSFCEHHMLPFSGVVHIGYIPNGQVLGLSKFARIAEIYSRRLQVQERLTGQIADAIVDTVRPLGVAVVMECRHFCMVMRGVEKTATSTTTSSVRGCFETNLKTRAEFFSIVNGGCRPCSY